MPRDSNGSKIVLIAFHGKAKARQVHISAARSDGYLVDGLSGGEDIIASGPPDLKDGDRIRIKGQS